jgi:hypothetical protein
VPVHAGGLKVYSSMKALVLRARLELTGFVLALCVKVQISKTK